LKLKVVLDCGCGVASVITPYLLRRLGCEVVALNCYPSGFFPRAVEPIKANLADLMRATREFGADLGIAHDGDADRMMAVDDKGRFIPGDKLLVLFAQQAMAKEVVTTIDASMVIDEIGCNVTPFSLRQRVVEAFGCKLDMESFIKSLTDGVCVLDREMRIVWLNREMERRHGKLDKNKGKKCFEVFHDEEEICRNCPVKATFECGKGQIMSFCKKKGEIEISTSPLKDSRGRAIAVIEVVRATKRGK